MATAQVSALGSAVLEPDLDSGLGKAEFQCQLLTDVGIWIVRIGEEIFKHAQLTTIESGPLSTMFSQVFG